MPLPAIIEFLAAQKSPDGRQLCHIGVSQVVLTLPPLRIVRFIVYPPASNYANYSFLVLADAVVVSGAISIEVRQYGALPYYGVLYPSATGRELNYFLRVTRSQPINNTVQNLTSLNQLFVSYDQSLVVANEADFNELERRIVEYENNTRLVTGSVETNRLLRKLVGEVTSQPVVHPLSPQIVRPSYVPGGV